MKALEAKDAVNLDAVAMCLVPDLVLPYKFKVPEFEKYTGDSCPKLHLMMFCRRMTSFVRNDKLMIHCFQYSLTGASLRWYVQLESNQIRSWVDLARAFVKQYNYNLDTAPSLVHL